MNSACVDAEGAGGQRVQAELPKHAFQLKVCVLNRGGFKFQKDFTRENLSPRTKYRHGMLPSLKPKNVERDLQSWISLRRSDGLPPFSFTKPEYRNSI